MYPEIFVKITLKPLARRSCILLDLQHSITVSHLRYLYTVLLWVEAKLKWCVTLKAYKPKSKNCILVLNLVINIIFISASYICRNTLCSIYQIMQCPFETGLICEQRTAVLGLHKTLDLFRKPLYLYYYSKVQV